MRKIVLLLVILVTGLNLNAQNVKLVNGLYQDVNGNLFSGLLITNSDKTLKVSELNITDGKLNGEVTYYYSSGKVMETGSFSEGIKSGLWIRYAETGSKLAWGTYQQGKKQGNWLVWDDNGTKRFDMHYEAGEKIGTWNSWDEKGELIATNTYGSLN